MSKTNAVAIDRLIRPAELRGILGVSRATLYRMLKPRPLRISAGAVGWRASTIAALLEEREREAAQQE